MDKNKKSKKICLISSSGGHYEQLRMLKKLENEYDIFWVTEDAGYASTADYILLQTGLRDRKFPIKMAQNIYKTFKIWFKEKPDVVITTGTMIVLPMAIMAKLSRRKLIYIETFARVTDGTRSGKLMYKIADLFIIQWKELEKVYPNAKYGGSIY